MGRQKESLGFIQLVDPDDEKKMNERMRRAVVLFSEIFFSGRTGGGQEHEAGTRAM